MGSNGKIVRFEAEAFKRLKVVEITPDGNVVKIRGVNGQGKTSVLDGIAAALGGEKLCPEVPIRRGEDRGHVAVELEDLIVTRRWTAKGGSSLEVTGKDGRPYKSPQKILDTLIGPLSFDPLAFTRMDTKKRAKLVADLVGLDLTTHDATRKAIYDDRTIVNREAERAASQVPAPVVGDVPDEEESLEALLGEIEKAEGVKRANDEKRAAVAKLVEAGKAKGAEVVKLEADLKAAKEALEKLRADHKAKAAEAKELKDPNVAALRERTKAIEATNAKIRQKKERTRLQAEAAAKKLEADQLTARLAELDKEREDTIKAAKFPVEGLGFADEALTLNGLPFEQASSAEQLRVSLAMGLALNPKLRVVLIRDGSLLDEKSLALVAETAAKADAQVWIEVVGTDGPAGVVIEDGQVVGAPEKPKKKAAAGETEKGSAERDDSPQPPAAAVAVAPKEEPKPATAEPQAEKKPEPEAEGGEQDCPF